MNPVLEDRSPVAIEGLTIALDAVDVIFESLLDQIQRMANEIERERDKPGFDYLDAAPPLGQLTRLNVQKQTIEALRKGIPEAILEGNAHTLARII